MATSRLALPQPTGSDLISGGDDAISAGFATLDNAAIFASGTFASRPAASALAGKLYYATDTGALYLSVGGVWVTITTGPEVPLGSSLDYAGSADPADTRFLLEDGRAISRSTYSALFSLIGTTYGGNGTTAFALPDLRRQAPGGLHYVIQTSGVFPSRP
jgi:hypothetical protein